MSSASGPESREGVIITHPNRDKPVVQATRATVVVLLLVSAALVLIVTIGGWNVLQGAVADPDRLYRHLPRVRVLRRPLEPGRAADLRVAGGAADDLRGRGGARMVRARQDRLRRTGHQRQPARAADASDRAGADPARSRLPCAASHRDGTSRSSAACPPPRPTTTATRRRTLPEPRGYPRCQPHCGGGGTVDAGPSKGPVRKGVWVRVPPAASSDLTVRRRARAAARRARAASRGFPTGAARARAARARAARRVRR